MESIRQFVIAANSNGIGLVELVKLVERETVLVALDRCHGNQSKAARLLGVHRNTLRRWLQKVEYKKQPPAQARQPVFERTA